MRILVVRPYPHSLIIINFNPMDRLASIGVVALADQLATFRADHPAADYHQAYDYQ